MRQLDATPNGTHALASQAVDRLRDHREVVPLPDRLLWDLEETAHVLGISGRTLKRMARAGELPQGCVVHLSRRRLFVRKAVEQWVADGCPPPARRRGGNR
jgi:predicted DNA-binding transcriptional regulator AlpA